MVGLPIHPAASKATISSVSTLDNVSRSLVARAREKGRTCETIVCLSSVAVDLNLPNGILYSRSCPSGLLYNAANDRCDYPSVVQC